MSYFSSNDLGLFQASIFVFDSSICFYAAIYESILYTAYGPKKEPLDSDPTAGNSLASCQSRRRRRPECAARDDESDLAGGGGMRAEGAQDGRRSASGRPAGRDSDGAAGARAGRPRACGVSRVAAD